MLPVVLPSGFSRSRTEDFSLSTDQQCVLLMGADGLQHRAVAGFVNGEHLNAGSGSIANANPRKIFVEPCTPIPPPAQLDSPIIGGIIVTLFNRPDTRGRHLCQRNHPGGGPGPDSICGICAGLHRIHPSLLPPPAWTSWPRRWRFARKW